MIRDEKRRVLCRCGSVLIFTLFLMLGLAVFYDVYYDLNDDTVIKDIIAGTYTGTPSGYSIQMLYPLSWLLAVLYTAIPGVAWYGLFLCMCQFVALAVIAWRLVGLTEDKRIQIVLLVIEAVVAAGVLLRNFVFVQYSVTSGLCMAAAIFWYITGDKEESYKLEFKKNVVALVLVWLSFGIRTELCVMLLPFLLLAGLFKWLSEERVFSLGNMKKYVVLIVSAFAGMLVLCAVDKVAYSSPHWKEFRDYFDARTDLYDFYGIPDYEEHQKFYQEIGLNKESYTLLQNYNFSLDESIDAELMQKIVEYQELQAKNGNGLHSVMGLIVKKSLKEAMWQYKEYLLNDMPCLTVAAYILFALLAFSRHGSGWIGKLLALVGVRSVIWMYLFIVDRFPERITIPLIFVEFIVLTGWIIREFNEQGRENTAKKQHMKKLLNVKAAGSILILMLCGVTALMINAQQTREEYEKRHLVNSRWEALIAYCKEHAENYYSVDVYSSTSFQGIAYSEKVFKAVDNNYRNFDICGGWAAKSPLMYEKLKQSGIEELEKDFVSDASGVFFIAACDKDIQWLREYYKTKGYSIHTEITDTIYADDEEAFYVYQLVIVN